jgi:predicted PurR-regulated permease PerM
MAALTLFFLYRDGDTLWRQIRKAAMRFGLHEFDRYAQAAGRMTRSVLVGFVLVALIQGVVAAIGYRIVGVSAFVLLGALTAALSLIPLFGTALVWGPLAVWLLINGEIWQGIVMLSWGIFLVHPIDNLLHPLLISGQARAPFLLVLFGVLGGLAAFGLVGLFVGPIILRLAELAWQEWVSPPQAPP